jgi:hypothetical protein
MVLVEQQLPDCLQAHRNSREAFMCETSSFPLLFQVVLLLSATCKKGLHSRCAVYALKISKLGPYLAHTRAFKSYSVYITIMIFVPWQHPAYPCR